MESEKHPFRTPEPESVEIKAEPDIEVVAEDAPAAGSGAASAAPSGRRITRAKKNAKEVEQEKAKKDKAERPPKDLKWYFVEAGSYFMVAFLWFSLALLVASVIPAIATTAPSLSAYVWQLTPWLCLVVLCFCVLSVTALLPAVTPFCLWLDHPSVAGEWEYWVHSRNSSFFWKWLPSCPLARVRTADLLTLSGHQKEADQIYTEVTTKPDDFVHQKTLDPKFYTDWLNKSAHGFLSEQWLTSNQSHKKVRNYMLIKSLILSSLAIPIVVVATSFGGAVIYLAVGKYAQAHDCMKTACAPFSIMVPGQLDYMITRATDIRAGNYIRAERDLKQSINTFTKMENFEAHEINCAYLDLAYIQIAQGHYDDATQTMKTYHDRGVDWAKAAAEFPNVKIPRVPRIEDLNDGYLAFHKGDLEGAESLFKLARDYKPVGVDYKYYSTAQPLAALANLYRDQGKLAEADDYYRKAIAYQADDSKTRDIEEATIRDDYAKMLRQLHRDADAEKIEAEARAIRDYIQTPL